VITGATALYGIVGWPVSHSRSPQMQGAAFAAAGIDAVFVACPAPPETLEAALAGAHALGFRGLNVTVPHKEAAARACETLDEVAARCGAANTLVRTATGWRGTNTDAPATAELLAAAGVGRGTRALLLGAGGAARAAAWALLSLGAEVGVAARRTDAAEALCRDLAGAGGAGALAEPVPWDDVEEASRAAAVVVNATSVGLPGKPGALPPLALHAGQLACDFVYGDTAFAALARTAGARLVSGEAILVRQGELAFQHWTGRAPPAGVMAAALEAGARSSGDLR
jgi:shikimate dehydrogenase